MLQKKKVTPIKIKKQKQVLVNKKKYIQAKVFSPKLSPYTLLLSAMGYATLNKKVSKNRLKYLTKQLVKPITKVSQKKLFVSIYDALPAVEVVSLVNSLSKSKTKQLIETLPATKVRQLVKIVPKLKSLIVRVKIPKVKAKKIIKPVKKQKEKPVRGYIVRIEKYGAKQPFYAVSGSISRTAAKNLGRFYADKFIYASYALEPTSKKASKFKFNVQTSSGKFRRPKGKTKLKGREIYVEIAKHRLDNLTETQQISLAKLKKLKSQKSIVAFYKKLLKQIKLKQKRKRARRR